MSALKGTLAWVLQKSMDKVCTQTKFPPPVFTVVSLLGFTLLPSLYNSMFHLKIIKMDRTLPC